VNKYVLSLLFLLAAASVWGQSKSKVNLVSSTTMRAAPGANGNRIIKVKNGVFKQDYSTLTSDSAYFYPDLNMVDAFSHVVINQGDTVHIYSDKLNYNGNTKIALLNDHVMMVDKDATLTTNNFTYNTATRIGTYVDGGKLVNKGNVLTSKNGYYFAFTRDAYFRYDVVCTTPDAVIKTDTMRYNSGTRITYFYGPTIITGKDKDNLYTENGTYNTATEQAFFGKKNLYTQQTKTLRGDSLFYDRLKGYGRATKHVIFNDSEQRITLKGDLGEYHKSNEEAVITQNAYMIFVTEDSTAVKSAGKKTVDDSVILSKPGKPAKTDSLAKKAKPVTGIKADDKKLTLKGITDSVTKKLPPNVKLPATVNKSTIKRVTDSINKKLPGLKNMPVSPAQVQAAKKAIPKFDNIVYKYADTVKNVPKNRPNIRYDSLYLVADTLKTQMVTYKDLKAIKQKQYDATHRDTSIKIVKKAAPIVYTKPVKFIQMEPIHWPVDTSFIRRDYFGKPTPPRLSPLKIAKGAKPRLTTQDSLKQKRKADSLALLVPKGLSDTARIRIVTAYNHAKIFKSDLQAKADSMFYASSDSTIRMYVNPMIWTQASQLSGDTVNLQMKNKKLDNLDMYPSAFIVNIDKNDSTFYNQAGGKKMHGTFKNSKLNYFVITGNAETIYFKRDSIKNVVTDMSRTVSGKAYFNFDNGEISSNAFAEKYEAKGIPIDKAKEEDKILKGFIWKPKDRPLSKESILSGYYKKAVPKKSAAKAVGTETKAGKAGLKKPGNTKAGKDGLAKPGDIKSGKDSLAKPANVKLGTDSVAKPTNVKLNTDSLAKPTGAKTGTVTPAKPTGNTLKKETLTKQPVIIKSAKDSVRRDTTPIKKSIILKP
jgi:lipopolysaccharide export system protein LptA